MALDGLGLGVGAGQEAEVCIDTRVLGLMQRTVTLEEKVGELFELLRDPIYLYLMAMLGNPAEAEDVTQETFLRLYRALHRGQSITNVRFFLFRVAHNLAFDLREKTQHREYVEHGFEALPSYQDVQGWSVKARQDLLRSFFTFYYSMSQYLQTGLWKLNNCFHRESCRESICPIALGGVVQKPSVIYF